MDVDLDAEGSKRDLILQKTKEKFGEKQVLNIATFGKIKTKSALMTVQRGMDLPLNVGQQATALISNSRGFDEDLETTYNNSKAFRDLMAQYPGWYEAAKTLEGLYDSRGSHASGVIIFNSNYTDWNAMMKTPNGLPTTQFCMTDGDRMGSLKLDYLSIDALDKIHQTMNLLIKDGLMEWQGSLRKTYDKYLHPSVIEDNPDFYEPAWNKEIISLFQFLTTVGGDAISTAKPNNLADLMAINSLMRLMILKTGEMPLDKFARFKKDIQLWYDEMDEYGLTQEEQKKLEPLYLQSSGVPNTQEETMAVLMEVLDWDEIEANKARKAIAKKKKEMVAGLKEKVFNSHGSDNLHKYIWETVIEPQLGYSFSYLHVLGYSTIALQELNLYNKYPHEYWNCGVLRASTGSEGDTIDFGKMSVAIANVQRHSIKISKPDINTSQLGFTPDTKNHTIRFGLRAIAGLSSDTINKIIENRPYSSFNDFMNKVQPTNTQALIIIKSGAFDNFDSISEILKRYEEYKIKQRKNITLTQTPLLKELKLIPNEYKSQVSLYDFNRYCKKELKKDKEYYLLDERTSQYLLNNYEEYYENGKLNIKEWDKQYKKDIKPLQQFYKDNKENLISKVRLGEMKRQYIEDGGLKSIANHEMETLNCYIHQHELATVDKGYYDISTWEEMPENPIQIGNAKYAPYKTYFIIGTVIRKEKTHSSITILDISGNTFNCQFNKTMFAKYEKEKYFDRHNLLMIQGFRRGSRFSPKSYKNSVYETVEKIEYVDNKGKMYFK